jgi:hypothetical protein
MAAKFLLDSSVRVSTIVNNVPVMITGVHMEHLEWRHWKYYEVISDV